MRAYEFSTCRTSDGKLLIPEDYIDRIPENTPVRIIILTEETYRPNDENPVSVEQIVKKIQKSVQKPENIQKPLGLLAEYLQNSPEKPDPAFNPEEWNREWDRIENIMNSEEILAC